MHSVPTRDRLAGGPDELETATCEFSTGNLGWRDLPPDGRVRLTVRFTSTELVGVHGSYQGRPIAFEIRDSTLGLVAMTDQSAQGVGAAGVRALRAALDEMGVRLARE